MLDHQAQTVLAELRHSHETQTPVDINLVDLYIPAVSKSLVLENPEFLAEFMPIINQLLYHENYLQIDPSQLTFELLQRILGFLSFSQILSFYPAEFILNSLVDHRSLQASKICLSIIILKFNEPETKQFLVESNGVYLLIQQYLSVKSLDIAIVNQIELLLHELALDETSVSPIKSLLAEPDFDLLYNKLRFAPNPDTTLLARLLDYILILVPFVPELNPEIYNFSVEEFVKFNEEDPLFSVFAVQFYLNLLKEIKRTSFTHAPKVFDNIKRTLANLTLLYRNPDIEDFGKVEIISVLAQLSYFEGEDYEFAKIILSNSEILKTHNLLNLYEYNELDIKLLSTLNPELIVSLNESIYEDVLSNIPLVSNNKYFPILLNSIKSPILFDQLAADYFESSTLSKVTSDKLFALLLEFSEHSHSKKYLFNNLPSIVNNYLIDEAEINIINPDLWNLKVQILQNLIQDDHEVAQELAFWKEQLSNSLHVMKFGRNVRDIAPKVDVMDQTA